MTSSLLAASAAEFRMQRRRPAVWVVLAVLGSFTLVTATSGIGPLPPGAADPLWAAAAGWGQYLNWFLPIGVGGLLADRVPRDRTSGVDELFASMAGSVRARLLGKCLGATAATLLPVTAVYAAGTALLAADRGVSVLPAAAVAFAAVTLPGLLAAAALSVALPAAVPVAAYQVVFAGMWYWAAAPGIPGSPYGTVLDPLGTAMADGLFGADLGLTGPPTALLVAANLAFLAVLTAVALLALPRLLAARAARS